MVGGTVRDLLLGQEPKDLDLLTSASLQQVWSVQGDTPALASCVLFVLVFVWQVRGVANQCRIVGHRHPIALVHAAHKKVIEVSTFQPSRSTPSDVANLARQGRQVEVSQQQPQPCRVLHIPEIASWHALQNHTHAAQ